MNKFAIADLDGFLADFEGRLVETLVGEFGEIGSRSRDKYSIVDRFQDVPQVLQFAADFINNPNSYYGLEPILDGLRLIRELDNRNIPIMYMTSRPFASYNFTLRWLRKNAWNFENAIGVEVVGRKAEHIGRKFHASEVAFVIDDNPDVCNYLNRLGFTCLCWRQPWNEDVFPALIPTRDAFYVVEHESDTGTNFLEELEMVKDG